MLQSQHHNEIKSKYMVTAGQWKRSQTKIDDAILNWNIRLLIFLDRSRENKAHLKINKRYLMENAGPIVQLLYREEK